ncbi:DNA/RNA non-specific endonuclease [Planctomonas psychrotolerans]|uniref:DNA/RNA non-specific endonuclease n=1 Tax=Planctomonas psychrotolerans TaxID=2528712 RepID=UPI00123A6F52|nr:DNA/RNA non-specific endonuclease [Planctomonas psychrotolerans]
MTTSDPKRTGYDERFLGLPDPVPLPVSPAGSARVVLDYTHFSVVLDTDRRLAAATAVNIDGDRVLDVPRSDDWHLDDRVPAGAQAGPELYARNDLDRGHLVRRRDPVWGDPDVAARANSDTFAYTNAAPQANTFNQSKELWLGLEDYILDAAVAFDRRLSVFTGVVFGAADPLYRGVRIPLLFWKVAAWAQEGGLAATAYLLDQTPQLDRVDLGAVADAPPLGPFRTFQVPVEEIARLTALDLGDLVAADRLRVPVPAPSARAGRAAWRELDSPAALTL